MRGVPLYVQCGTISSNSQYGIYLGSYSSLDMSYNVFNTGVPAQVTAINNGITIRPYYATGLNLNGGRNDLTPLVSGSQTVVNGSLIWGCSQTTIIDAYRNKWNSLGNPASAADYLLDGYDISQVCQLTLVDNTPIIP